MQVGRRLAGCLSGLDGHKPPPAFTTDRDVSDLAIDLLAQTQSDSAELGQEDAAIARIEPELFGFWKTDAGITTVLFEVRKPASLIEKSLVGFIRTLEHVLLWVGRAFGQLGGIWRVTPGRQSFAHFSVSSVLLAMRVPRTLLSQRFVPEPAKLAAPAVELSLLVWLAAQRKAKGFDLVLIRIEKRLTKGHITKIQEQTCNSKLLKK